MSAKSPWTPYGLEAIRTAHLRRRRFLALATVLGLALLWLMMFTSTTSNELSIQVNGKEQNRIELDIPEEDPDDGPVSVEINPGRVTRAETTNTGTGSTIQRANVPAYDRAAPLNWSYYVLLYGPYVLIGLALYLLAQRRGKHDEINYGIYKGSMPLEMISAAATQDIFTTREKRASIFGKRRGDYLPPEVRRVERMEQEDA